MPCPTQSVPASPIAVTRPLSAGAEDETPVSTTPTVTPVPEANGQVRLSWRETCSQGTSVARRSEPVAQAASASNREANTGSWTVPPAAVADPAPTALAAPVSSSARPAATAL